MPPGHRARIRYAGLLLHLNKKTNKTEFPIATEGMYLALHVRGP